MKKPCVYILASSRNGTLYTGVTSNLVLRINQHASEMAKGFTSQYHVHMLVWFEEHDTMNSAIEREKAIKKWNRLWKIRLIEERNPDWCNLANQF